MTIGFIGLGRMGYNMVLRLLEKNYRVVAYDTDRGAREKIKEAGVETVSSLAELSAVLGQSKLIWIMVPRRAVGSVLGELTPFLQRGDVLLDGGNTYFEDTIKRANELELKGIGFLDVGVSGGVEGARTGATMMVGGFREYFTTHEQLFRDLSVKEGYGYMGKSGAGHFVKMVHNAIEYGMMGAIAEGTQALREKEQEFGTDIGEVLRVYSHCSIIESRLVDWLLKAWKEDPLLTRFPNEVPEGETEAEMEKFESLAEVPVLTVARTQRVKTRTAPSFVGKVINALRFQFGGHSPKKK